MEAINYSYQGLPDGDWLSPRISFSHDFHAPDVSSPAREKIVFTEDELSFDFCNTISLDPCADDSMLSADELFCDGKLLPLQKPSSTAHSRTLSMICSYDRYDDESGGASFGGLGTAMSRSIQDNPRSCSMSITDCRSGYGERRRACMSTSNSRASSPSKVRFVRPATEASLNTVRVPVHQQTPSQSPIQPSATVSASSSSSRYSSKFKEIFRLKKTLKDHGWKPPSNGSQVCRDPPHGSVSISGRLLTAKSFWPFSRSNSAGESKTQTAVPPIPRRSNSAGESKTTSSSLFHANGTLLVAEQCDEQQIVKESSMSQSFRLPNHGALHGMVHHGVDMATLNDSQHVNVNISKKGLPPLPNSTVKVCTFSDPAAAQSVIVTMGEREIDEADNIWSSPHDLSMLTDDGPHRTTLEESEHCRIEEPQQNTTANGLSNDAVHALPPSCRGMAATSHARAMRRCPSNTNARNFARGSPGRRTNWNSPGRGNAGRIAIKNLDRGKASVSNRNLMRPKDMLTRDGSSVRVPPVLNVPLPSRRAVKVATKSSKMFSLGSLFSKKDKSPGSYVLLAAGTESGG